MNRTFVAAVAGLVLIAGCGAEKASGHQADERKPRSPAPSTFVAVRDPGPHPNMAVYSAYSGRLVRLVTSTGFDFTNNGLALSPDGRWIYATWIGKHSLRIERISSTGGPRTFIANGSQPAISPDGRYLAYAAGKGDGSVAVRDLRTGRTRWWNLRAVIGTGTSLFNGTVFWLGSGELAVHPGDLGTRATGSGTSSENPGECGPRTGDATCLVYFDPRLTEPPLKHRLIRPGRGSADFSSAGTNAPNSAVGSRFLGESTELDLVDLRTGHRSHLATVEGLTLALDRTGTHLLYLVGHSPPALWSAEIRGGRLIDRHRILANGQIAGGVTW